MKKLKLPKSLLVTLAAPAIASLVIPAGHAIAQGQTETKMRLLADALRARDSGDLDTAKKNLEDLLAIAPGDATVQRLLANVNASIAARASGASVVETTSAPAQSEPVQVTLPSANKAGSSSMATDSALSTADQLTKEENQRIKALISDASGKRSEARSLAKDGRFEEASAVLDGAINSLPANPATTEVIADLQAEKNNLFLAQAQYALGNGDTKAARAALEAHAAATAAAPSKKADKIGRNIDSVELNPPLQPIEKVNPQFIADQKEIAGLVAKGRSQYLAGDVDGAQETFRIIESIDVSNPEAKSFLTRISKEKANIGELNRAKTAAQMLEEVANSWQRPGVYQDRSESSTGNQGSSTPLAQKLNAISIPSVNFNGVELSRVISTLSAISQEYDNTAGAKGVNIVLLDPSNKNPNISITLRDLTLKRILDLITDSAGYQYEVTADTVIVRPGGDIGPGLENAFFPVSRATVIRMTGIGAPAAASSSAALDPFAPPSAAPAGGGGGGESGALQSFLEQAGVKFATTPGSSLVYDGSAIIVNQTSRNIERIRNILNRYNDVRQVEIEAKFMDVQEGALEEVGVNWTVRGADGVYTTANRSLASVFGGSAGGSSGQIVRAFEADREIINNPAIVPGAANVGLSSSSGSFANASNELAVVSGILGEFNVEATIRALSQKTGTELLSSPKVTVLSGNPANIVVAQELRYPQSYGETQSTVSSGNTGGSAISITAGTPQEFTTRNVGVELKVTPTVEEDDYSISLDLNPRVTEFDGFVEYGGQSVALTDSTTVTVPSGFYQPIFSTREVTTKVTVWDGATLVLGGLTREEVKKTSDKVPVLGDIPFIGRAFRSKGETSSKRNLLIFVTANLVSPGGSPKKQQLKSVAPSSTFQNPTLVTPASAEPRVRGGK
jgi:general secretion pathway protein D